jgi:hypothetical protein
LTGEDPEPSNLSNSELTDEVERMRVDGEVDDDLILGAVLNIGIEDLPFQKIWFRADYIRMYDYIETRHICSPQHN